MFNFWPFNIWRKRREQEELRRRLIESAWQRQASYYPSVSTLLQRHGVPVHTTVTRQRAFSTTSGQHQRSPEVFTQRPRDPIMDYAIDAATGSSSNDSFFGGGGESGGGGASGEW